MADLKHSPMFEQQRREGAKTAPLAGWSVVTNYHEGASAEHLHTRKRASVFDFSFAGKFRIAGKTAGEALDRVFERPLSSMLPGECAYHVLTDGNGAVTDEVLLCRMAEDDFFAVTGAGTGAAERIAEIPAESAAVSDLTGLLGKVILAGPLAADVLEEFDLDRSALPELNHCGIVQIGGENFIVSRSGHTGELEYEIMGGLENTAALWSELVKTPNVAPGGLNAYTSLCLENGHLFRSSSGTAAVKIMPDQQLCGILLDSRRVPPPGAKVYCKGAETGIVCGGAFLPVQGTAALLAPAAEKTAPENGDAVRIIFDGGELDGVICSLPFLKNGTKDIKF